MTNVNKYDIGVIGNGVAVQMASDALKRYKNVAISCKSDPNLVDPAFDFFPDPRIFFEDQIAKCLYIATPVNSHSEFISSSVKSKLRCLVEKPLLTTFAAARKFGPGVDCYVAVAFKKRYSPLAKLIRNCRSNYPKSSFRIRYTYLAPHPGHEHWKVHREISGGGAVMDIGSHVLDFLEHCVGRIQDIKIVEYQLDTTQRTDNYVSILVKFENHSFGEVVMGWANGQGFQKVDFVQDDTEISWQKSGHQNNGSISTIKGRAFDYKSYHRNDEYFPLFDAFQDWVEGRDSNVPRWSDGVRNLEIIEAIERLGVKLPYFNGSETT